MITSLLDNDYYAFTMSAAIFLNGDADLNVRYEFRNRTFAVPLASRLSLPLLKEHIADIQKLRFQPSEIDWLRAQKVFPEPWLEALPGMRLPDVQIGQVNEHLTAHYEAPWWEAVFWESVLLALINETYYSRFGMFYDEGTQRLQEKIEYLRERGTITFSDFGTRRRFSKDWHHYVIHELVSEIPDLLVGTSNAAIAKELNLRPIGTMAHQLFMVNTALAIHLRESGRDAIQDGISEVLHMWEYTYRDHPDLLTVLPDTYGTDAFISRVYAEDLAPFTGFRQDSGDPVYRSEQLLTFARRLGKPDAKIVPSDSLDVRKMSVIEDHLRPQEANLGFGWGTNLTNDLGYEPLSLVIKPSAVQAPDGTWLPCVKFSDDPQKVTGNDAATAPYYRMLQRDNT